MSEALIIPDEIAEKHVKSCLDAGMSEEQIKLFTEFGYIPHQVQQQFHAYAGGKKSGPSQILMGGARAGGKTHGSFGQTSLHDCQKYPNLSCLFLRKVQSTANRSFDDLVKRILIRCPHEKMRDSVIFPNGSTIRLGGFRIPSDIEKYVGIEYDLIIVEELTQLSKIVFDMLRGSLRTSRQDGWECKMYLSANPGGIGHSWVKEMFVEPFRNGTEHIGNTKFITSMTDDNPHINAEYKTDYLDSLTGNLRAMWRDGDWDLAAGRAFPNFNERNIVDSFDFNSGQFLFYRGVDYGLRAPYCCLWVGYDLNTGRVVVFREDYKTDLPASQQAERIAAKTPIDEDISATYADPAMFAKTSTEEGITSVADIYADHAVYLRRGDNSRINGKRKVDSLLVNKPDGIPGLLVYRSCTNLIEQMNNLMYSERDFEDVDTSMDDHAYDAFRYAISSVRDAGARNRSSANSYKSDLFYFFGRR